MILRVNVLFHVYSKSNQMVFGGVYGCLWKGEGRDRELLWMDFDDSKRGWDLP